MSMKLCNLFLLNLVLLSFIFVRPSYCEETISEQMKSKSTEMIRFGLEAHERKRYLDAKKYFRNAIQYNPNSDLAWEYYDIVVIFALAERVKQNSDLIQLLKKNSETSSISDQASDTPKQTETDSDYEFKIIEEEGDEGCY